MEPITSYDSLIEKLYHQQHQHLERQLDYLPTTFVDDNGIVFKAKADYYDTISNTYIEVKNRQLNNYKSKQASLNRQQVLRQRRGGYLTNIEQLESGWNHSIYKHLIVQQTLAILGIKYLVVFYRPTKLTKQSINKMRNLGLNFTVQ